MASLTNSVLLEIALPGAPDDYGEVTTAGNPAWEGVARGYLQQINRSMITGGSGSQQRTDMTLVQVMVFTILRTEGAPALAAAGDDVSGSTVLIRDHRVTPAVDRRFRVTAVENRFVGSYADNVRLELDDEQAA